MDKYTVDLDQVLNDFEYSELRDEHTTLTIQNNIQTNSLRNNFKNTNVKHSINTVFHSLNEYLGTEIAPKQNNQDRERESESSGVYSGRTETEECVSDAKPVEEPVAIAAQTEEVAQPEDFVQIEEENALNSEKEAENTVENDSDSREETLETVENLVEIDAEPTKTIITVVAEESNGNLDQNLSRQCDNEEESIRNDPEPRPEPKVEEIPAEKPKEPADKPKDSVEKPKDSVEKLKEPEQAKVTCFDDNVELDESELSKYLDELEVEFGESTKKEQEQEVKSESPPVEAPSVATTVTRPTELPIPSQDTEEDSKQVINLIGDPGSTPFNNVYVDKELAAGVASPTLSEASSDTTSSCTPSTDTVADEPPPQPPPSTTEASSTTNSNPESVEQPPPVAPSTGFWLGKQAPLWIPDSEANSCLHCDQKFTVIKRRHHCRACGYVLCSKCCNLRMKLDYLEGELARVCIRCHDVLSNQPEESSTSTLPRQPNPNNPSEYCSTVPPLQQQSGDQAAAPSVMVPVGVLKRKGSNKGKTTKSVMFCDGIRPGSDLSTLDGSPETVTTSKPRQNHPIYVAATEGFIPEKGDELPPLLDDVRTYSECKNDGDLVAALRTESKVFALQTNLVVHVKIVELDCCVNKTVWCFTTQGMMNVGQDEIVILLEVELDEPTLPKDILLHLNRIYRDAVKGSAVKEMGLSLHSESLFLTSKNHAGFVYIKPTFQCTQHIIKPTDPYLIGILIHRWETPWAKLFPLRLVLRLGAESRYYPSPLVSTRHRDSVFVEIGHTIINLLADFRNFSYTLPQIRGLTIHMEDKNTTVTIPTNRYDQIQKSLSNSSDYILAFAGNFSTHADSHLVCIQNTQSNDNEYTSHAINIHNKPRKVTGASFIVFNGALKSSSGLTAKSSIVEDGLMIQITPETMNAIREALRNTHDYKIQCGCINATSDETVSIVWGEADTNFNLKVFSPIDGKSMEGVPSIRVHNGKDFTHGNRMIRWTEVFILQNEHESRTNQEPLDISKLSETISKAACIALVKYLDLLASNNCFIIGIRTNLNTFPASYSAGSNGSKLPPIYMESLDNELIPVLHQRNNSSTDNSDDNVIVLELILRLLYK